MKPIIAIPVCLLVGLLAVAEVTFAVTIPGVPAKCLTSDGLLNSDTDNIKQNEECTAYAEKVISYYEANPRQSGGAVNQNPAGGPTPGGAANQNPSASQGSLSYSLENPLAFESLEGFIVAILNVIIVITTPIVVIFIILAGFKYVTARGNANDVQEATKALTYAIIGGVLIIGAVAIAEIIKGLVTAFS